MSSFALLGIILLLILCAAFLRQKEFFTDMAARKIVHIGAISIAASAVYLVPDMHELLIVAASAVPFLIVAVYFGFFEDRKRNRKSWGMVYFAVIYVIMLALFARDHKELVYYPFLILAWADGMATGMGERFGKKTYPYNDKTVIGSASFGVITILALAFGHLLFAEAGTPFGSWSAIFFVTVFLTILEAISIKGRDNLWIPPAVAYWMIISPEAETTVGALFFLMPAIAGYLAFRKQWLSPTGSFAAILLGWTLLFNPEPRWILPALFFFICGTILSKLPDNRGRATEGIRTGFQVFSNGGLPVAFIAAYHLTGDAAFLIGGLSGFASALSDTASSEIGVRVRAKTYSLIRFRKVPPGLSGGVSFPGVLAGVIFAIGIAGFSVFLSDEFGFATLVLMAVTGMAGNLMDSLIGDLFQAKYKDSLGRWSDQEWFAGQRPDEGWKPITNNVVNFLSVGIASLGGFLCAMFS